MKEIRIGPGAQLLGTLAFLGLIGGAVYSQLPEIQRYLKVRSM
jgi:hypothetical protein